MTCGCHDNSGIYLATCDGCKARAIANSPDGWLFGQNPSDPVARAWIQDPTERAFPGRYAEGRALVWAWIMKRRGSE